jgi:hypothetical protein
MNFSAVDSDVTLPERGKQRLNQNPAREIVFNN